MQVIEGHATISCYWNMTMLQIPGNDQATLALNAVKRPSSPAKIGNPKVVADELWSGQQPTEEQEKGSSRRVRNQRVRFSPNCTLILIQRIKKKYAHRLWYRHDDFAAFKRHADRIVSLMQSYDGSHEEIITELGKDRFLGLEKVVSYDKMRLRHGWKMAAYNSVFSMQQEAHERRNYGKRSDGVSKEENPWFLWHAIAESYANLTAESKEDAKNVAKNYYMVEDNSSTTGLE